jgi:large subunit ribosomal protein L18
LVFRSNKYIYAQLVDAKGTTLSGTRGKDPEEVGKAAATKAKKLKVGRVVFDRGGHKYHGRVKLLAEAARKEGLGL